MKTIFTFSIVDRVRSVRHAIRGLRTMLQYEQNAWIHASVTLVVAVLGFYFRFNAFEWCWIVLSVVSVWTSEALNTAFEFLADVASPEFHPMVEKAKDVAAAAVLITCIGAVLIGFVIIGPHVVKFLMMGR
jgi:diacylglycerol kinase (ATP)